MRSYIAVAGVLALTATANAANCNPSYNVASAGSCIANCNSNSAKAFDSSWTSDPASAHFIDSLALMCDKIKSGALYTAFMSSAGMCMTACSADEQNGFYTEYSGACAWYAAHANDACAAATTTAAAATTTTTAAAVVTTTAAAAATTTAAAATTAASTSAISTIASNSTSATFSSASNSTVSPSGVASNSSSIVGNTTTPVSSNTGAASSASAAGKLEYGAITAVAVAFAAFIAL